MMEPTFFAIVLLLATIALVAWRRGRSMRRPIDPRAAVRKAKITLAVIVGGAVVFGVLYARASEAARAFSQDPSCSDDASGSRAPGACSLERMAVVRAYAGGRGNADYLIDLRSANGVTTTVVWSARSSAPTGRGWRLASGDDATAELFRGRIVAVRTAAVAFETSDFPARRRTFDAIAALECGGFACLALYTITIWPRIVSRASARLGNERA